MALIVGKILAATRGMLQRDARKYILDELVSSVGELPISTFRVTDHVSVTVWHVYAEASKLVIDKITITRDEVEVAIPTYLMPLEVVDLPIYLPVDSPFLTGYIPPYLASVSICGGSLVEFDNLVSYSPNVIPDLVEDPRGAIRRVVADFVLHLLVRLGLA